MNNKIKLGDVVQHSTRGYFEYAIVIKSKKGKLSVKNAENEVLQISSDRCSKIEVLAVKIGTKDFDKIANGLRVYKHKITDAWKLIADQQPELIKFYADRRTAIIYRLFNCTKFVKNTTKYSSSIWTLTEQQFYVRIYIKAVLFK